MQNLLHIKQCIEDCMLTLLSKICQYLSDKQNNYFSGHDIVVDRTSSSSKTRFNTSVNAFQASRPPGTGRRSNRDRKPAASIVPVPTSSNEQQLRSASQIDKNITEGEIRLAVDTLPLKLKESYLIILESLLAGPVGCQKNKHLQALKTAIQHVIEKESFD